MPRAPRASLRRSAPAAGSGSATASRSQLDQAGPIVIVGRNAAKPGAGCRSSRSDGISDPSPLTESPEACHWALTSFRDHAYATAPRDEESNVMIGWPNEGAPTGEPCAARPCAPPSPRSATHLLDPLSASLVRASYITQTDGADDERRVEVAANEDSTLRSSWPRPFQGVSTSHWIGTTTSRRR